MNIQRPLLLAAALSSVLLAACAAPSTNRDSADAAAKPAAGAALDAAKNGPAPAAAGIDLPAYTWHLERASDAAGKPIALLQREGKYGLQLSFGDGRLGVSGGCNRAGAAYALDGDKLQIKSFQTTLMACQDQRLMQMDSEIAKLLEGSARVAIQVEAPQPRLTLTAASGAKLELSGEATAETRYGGPGTTAFFEVDAQRRSCPHPLIPNHQCLWVRERKYDANGVALKPEGDWQFLYQEIEGYTHEPGVRNVVRVKKFELKNPPADAPSVAYVLDMVVESELVAPKR